MGTNPIAHTAHLPSGHRCSEPMEEANDEEDNDRLCALALTGTFVAVAAHEATAQGGTAPESQSMGASQSGSAIDSKPGQPTTKSEFDKGFTGQESGIGEKGTGQDRSTMERERVGGKQGSREERHQSSDLSQGKSAQAAKETQAQGERNR